MTDTEILDYLQEAETMRPAGVVDVKIGSVLLTLGLRGGTIREKLIEAIQQDQQRIADRVARKLTGGGGTAFGTLDANAKKAWADQVLSAASKAPFITKLIP